MSNHIGQFDQIPTKQLVQDVQTRGDKIASAGTEAINYRDAGHFLSIYTKMFENIGPVSDGANIDLTLSTLVRVKVVEVAMKCRKVLESLHIDLGEGDLPSIHGRDDFKYTYENNIGIIGATSHRLVQIEYVEPANRMSFDTYFNDPRQQPGSSFESLSAQRYPLSLSADSVIALVQVAAEPEQFKQVFRACELLMPPDDRVSIRNNLVGSIACVVSSTWQNADWVPPMRMPLE
jgi:hypothetical protein